VHLTERSAKDPRIRASLAGRIAEVKMVEKVDRYDDWFDRLSAIAAIGRVSAWGLGLLAMVVAILVVAAVIKTGVASRTREIEVLGLVGATNRYIRLPFALEGAIEAGLAMAVSILTLQFLLGYAQGVLGDILPVFNVGSLSGLGLKNTLYLFTGSIIAGLLGARLSLRGVAGA
jgi:cell division transport system permease protein